MASLALYLKNHHHKPHQTLLKSTPNLTFSHLFSSSSSNNNNDDNNNSNFPKSSDFGSYFSDIKSRLKNEQQQQQQQQQGAKPSIRFSPQVGQNPPKVASLDDIRKNLSEFRSRASPEPPNSKQPTLFQDVYKRNMANVKPTNAENGQRVAISFDKIRESLSQLRANPNEKGQNNSVKNEQLSLSNYKANFRLTPQVGSPSSGKGPLPVAVFGKELQEKERRKKRRDGKEEEEVEDEVSKNELYKQYSKEELGEKLKELRPDVAKKTGKKGGEGDWFSLEELNERLKKLREIEMQAAANANVGGLSFSELRHSLNKLKLNEEKAKPVQRYDLLGPLSHSQTYMSPPKEHLVEKYFHPDNMSSAEKLKIELKKVRDEFKMHESDCGSARVQIAILTTEISHLSSVLHKKDKHSRKGLLAKVQMRKKLLKYLRRTDWDSYCFVLSKLGLRDNPDYKH